MIPPYSNQNNKNNDEMAEKVSKVVDNFKENPEPWDLKYMGNESVAKEKILNRLLFSINSTEKRRRYNLKKIATWSAAAVILICISVGLLLKVEFMDEADSFQPQVTIATKQGEQRKINLPDGSVVTLNAASKISYSLYLKGKIREVTLVDGEAFFDVKHDEKRPFQVKAGKTLTHVLGTAFNISSYSFLKTINITVAKGKVAVNNEMLLPNQQIVYNKASATLEKKKMLASNITSWMQGILSFTDQDFKSVAAILEHRYHVRIIFEDKEMENLHFTARFDPAENLPDVLEALTITMGLSYEINKDKIIIKK